MIPIYQHAIYLYDDPNAAAYRALFPDQHGRYIVVITGLNADLESSNWLVVADSLFVGIWDLYAFVHKAYGANGERVYLLAEIKVRA